MDLKASVLTIVIPTNHSVQRAHLNSNQQDLDLWKQHQAEHLNLLPKNPRGTPTQRTITITLIMPFDAVFYDVLQLSLFGFVNISNYQHCLAVVMPCASLLKLELLSQWKHPTLSCCRHVTDQHPGSWLQLEELNWNTQDYSDRSVRSFERNDCPRAPWLSSS